MLSRAKQCKALCSHIEQQEVLPDTANSSRRLPPSAGLAPPGPAQGQELSPRDRFDKYKTIYSSFGPEILSLLGASFLFLFFFFFPSFFPLFLGRFEPEDEGCCSAEGAGRSCREPCWHGPGLLQVAEAGPPPGVDPGSSFSSLGSQLNAQHTGRKTKPRPSS